MKENLDILKKLFSQIKQRGWIEGTGNNYGSIGNTFERLLGIQNNELEIPDFNGIEIKTKTTGSLSYTSLFSCTATGPHYHEVERLKELYGYPDSKLKNFKVLNTIICCGTKTQVGTKFFFELKVDRENQKLYLIVYDKEKNIIENNVYWDFDILEEKLYRKLKYIAYVNALKKKFNNKKYFKYYKMKFYKLKNFETFIDLLDRGIIHVSIKIGIYRDIKRLGKIHDHGTSFGIQEKDFDKLYELLEIYI